MEIVGDSSEAGVPGVDGAHTGVAGDAGIGVRGTSDSGRGVVGSSDTDYGMRAHSNTSSGLRASSRDGAGVEGESQTAGPGVRGTSVSGFGVQGVSDSGRGVVATSNTDYGMRTHSNTSSGLRASSRDGAGVEGESQTAGPGVRGTSISGIGVYGASESYEGVRGESKNANHGGVVGVNTGGGAAIYGKGTPAGYFEGTVEVTGDIRLLNADFAEHFNIAGSDEVEPGTLVVLWEAEALIPSSQAYDKRVVGVVAGAGAYQPAIVLDAGRGGPNPSPVALLGKAYCKVDASSAPIEVGDLLTTSNTPGHAMKASDPVRAFGAVVGKALRPLAEGTGLIPVLITLQ